MCLVSAVAQNRTTLLRLGITHVLNAAHSKQGSIGNQSFYGSEVVYCGIPADDSTHFDLDVYFKPAADFIHKALKSPDGELQTRYNLKKKNSKCFWFISIMGQTIQHIQTQKSLSHFLCSHSQASHLSAHFCIYIVM